MGYEGTCAARFGDQSGEGHLHLDSTALTFRGPFRLNIPLRDITAVRADGDQLVVVSPQGEATFGVGKSAKTWAAKLAAGPKGRLDKLGVKDGMRVAVLGVPAEEGFLEELAVRTGDIATTRPRANSGAIFHYAAAQGDLLKLAKLRGSLVPDGMIWVLWPKGRKELREDDIRRGALAAGLVDVKVASFSDRLSALKLVIPVAQRPAAPQETGRAKVTPEIPADLAAALKAAPVARRKFERLPQSHRKAYLDHIGEAKRPATRAKRIADMIERLTAEVVKR
ncbi:MAG TPA: YdeI/OmpD-associated family protein [bacterium]|nr:YdeI/OmpD-associated family protein [bacterium]